MREAVLEQSACLERAKQALQLEKGQGKLFVLWLSLREQQRAAGPLCCLCLFILKREGCICFLFSSD